MAKRISQSSVNWASLAERVPPEQRVNLAAFKIKSDTYLRRLVLHWSIWLHNCFVEDFGHHLHVFRVMANPPEAPKINWAQYKNTIPVAGMVDTFQKKYEALSIPYPADTLTSKVDAQWVEIKKAIEVFVNESNANIAK